MAHTSRLLHVLTIVAFGLITMTTFAQTLPAPRAITDSTQLQSTQIDNLQAFTIAQLYHTRATGSGAWSPDSKQVAFISNISGRSNVWVVSSDGGWPTQLTVSDQRQSSPAWSPDGKWIAYISDYDGDELWDVFLVSPLNGEVVNLTASRQSDDEQPAWSPDGKQVAYITRQKTSPSFEIDVIDVLTRRTRHITRNTPPQLSNSHPIWSKDGKQLIFTQSHASGKDSNIFVADLASGTLTNITPHQGEQIWDAAAISPDGKHVLATSDAANGYANVALIEVASKKVDWLTQDKWEITPSDFTRDGRAVVWSANVDGYEDIYTYELASKKIEKLPLAAGINRPSGAESAFSADGARMMFQHNGANAPNDLWLWDVKQRTAKQLTHSLIGGLRAADMVEPTLVHYPSRDGKFTISALVYMPHNIMRNQTFPAIVYIHGGPISQSMNSFNRFIQYIANQGYVVIAPNYRGGSGYGKEFQNANRMDAGGQELNDVLDAAEFIKRSGFVDPKKLIAMGGSYGGYLTMMAVTKAPDMWAAGVPIVPFVNWFTEFANEDPTLQESDRLFMGDPVKDKALWEDRSPINFIDRVKAPLLLLAGANDPRCPKDEAQQVADAIKARGGVAQLKIYENEGHGFARVENQVDAYKRVSDFLKVRVPSPGCGRGPCVLTPQ
ncbi:MAG TPA: S9 family peptidase [Terriglobales bacterium]